MKKRAKARQHTRRTKTGKTVIVNKGVTKTYPVKFKNYDGSYTDMGEKGVIRSPKNIGAREWLANEADEDSDVPRFGDNPSKIKKLRYALNRVSSEGSYSGQRKDGTRYSAPFAGLRGEDSKRKYFNNKDFKKSDRKTKK